MAKRVIYTECRVKGCPNPPKIQGFCPKDYARFKKYGLAHMLDNHYLDHEDYTKYVGRTFNKWRVLAFVERKKNSVYMKCRCSCGTISTVLLNNLKAGVSKGCKNCKAYRNTVHGLSGHPCYSIWRTMMGKCYNKNHPEYISFGAQGITVCKRWHSFQNFVQDIPAKQEGKKFVLISHKKKYSPDNVAWLTTLQIKDLKQLSTHKLTASLLGRLTGYTRERIHQLTNMCTTGDMVPVLDKFILRREIKRKYTIIIYKPAAIKFLKSWKKRIHKDNQDGK